MHLACGTFQREVDRACPPPPAGHMRVTPSLVTSLRCSGASGGSAMGCLIRRSTSLHTLMLGWNCIRHKGAADLIGSLAYNKSLHDLDLSWNPMGEDALLLLAPILEGGYALPPHSDDVETTEGAVVATTTVDTGLEHLRLTSTGMTPRAAFAVAMGFSLNKTLKTIDCSQNPIGEEGVAGGSYGGCAACGLPSWRGGDLGWKS